MQRQPRVLAQRMEMDLRKALLRQPHVIRRSAQISQRVRRVVGQAQRVGIDKGAQVGRAVGSDPARAGVLAAL